MARLKQEQRKRSGEITMKLALNKRMIIMLVGVAILFGGIFGYHVFTAIMFKKFMSAGGYPPETVAVQKTKLEPWQPKISTVGTLKSRNGVDVTTEITGLVKKIHFESGAQVKRDDLLVELNADSDIAQLQSLEATAALAKATYERDKAQYAINGISKAALEASEADLKSKEAQVKQQAAVVAKKNIRAPFSGKLGISAINDGQYMNPGDKIVSLQTLDPILIDFHVPQKFVSEVRVGQKITVTLDSYPDQKFQGKITSMDPIVNLSTRNLRLEATISNRDGKLIPGMFGNVEIQIGAAKNNLTIPQTAIAYNPYGDVVYVVKVDEKSEKGHEIMTAHPVFVTVGETRGDQVAILKGLEENMMIVISGSHKLKNGSRVVIDNTVLPSNEAAPTPPDDIE